MNQLNQIIVEGTVAEIGEIRQGLYAKSYDFLIKTVRNFKNLHGERETETSSFRIKTFGNVAERCSEKAEVGRGVRVVGRLVNDNGDIHIVADHVDFRPEANK